MTAPKRPRDPNQLAKQVVDLATMSGEELAAKRIGDKLGKPSDDPKPQGGEAQKAAAQRKH